MHEPRYVACAALRRLLMQEVVTALTLPPPGIFQSSQMLIEAKKRRSEAPSDTQALLGQKLWAG